MVDSGSRVLAILSKPRLSVFDNKSEISTIKSTRSKSTIRKTKGNYFKNLTYTP